MKNKIIIIFSGKQYSGKDTAAALLLENFKSFVRIGIGDTIKQLYAKNTGLTLLEIEKNKSKYRQDLIELGNWGRAQNPDFWLKKAAEYDGNIIVTDVRMKHELDVFRSYGAFTVRVEASFETRKKRGIITASNDNTETELDDIKDWDFVLFNDGDLEQLRENIQKLISILKLRYGENL